MYNKTKHLNRIIKNADYVLSSAERNKFGKWIGNEHLLLEWINDIKQFIENYPDKNNELYIELISLTSSVIGTPNDVLEVKKVLEEICLDYSE